MDLCYSSTSRAVSYSNNSKKKYYGTGGVTIQNTHVGTPTSEAFTSTQPPFLLYPLSTIKPINTHGSSIQTIDNNVYPYMASSLSGQMARSPSDPSMPAPYPQTPPPSRAPRHYGYTQTIVSPPAPLRITTTSSRSQSTTPHLRYERIGPDCLKMYRLSLPPQLIHCQLDSIVAHAERFAKDHLVNGWHTDLYSLTKQDIALRDIPGMAQKIQPIFDFVTYAIRTLYGCQKVVVDKNQPHILKYSVDSGHTGVELHHDRCDVTANLALSRSGDYCGGGTYIRDTGSIVKLKYGECLLHPGNLVHGGMEVTKGTRYLMVTFAHLR